MKRNSWFGQLFGGAAAKFAAPAPQIPLNIIGDIHGCLPLLDALVAQLSPDTQLVCVGDYVDRGDDSAGVLRWLHARPDIICLRGNHEDMMLGFLEDPKRKGARWVKYGGLQTLASFGITGVTETSDKEALTQARDALAEAMGQPLIHWLTALPTRYLSGNIAVVHAGADPELPISMQSDKTLMWGHPGFETRTRSDGVWVVYGHTITPEPAHQAGRIGIDTGAYATGRLTALCLSPDGQIEFRTT